ncbi:MAG: DUF4160 domain-containing protein [Verrucomicrobiota bacterium]
MPEICRFLGIVIYMYFNDHSPPHFHAEYGSNEILVNINTLEIMEGNFPRRAKNLVMEWAMEHREELRQNWERAANRKQLHRIEPLT